MARHKKTNGTVTITGGDKKIVDNLPARALNGPQPAVSIAFNPVAAGKDRIDPLLDAYARDVRDEDDVDWSVAGDFVADTLHALHARGIDVEQVLRVARSHFEEEQMEMCERCGGPWGEDETCARCTNTLGEPRDRNHPGPMPVDEEDDFCYICEKPLVDSRFDKFCNDCATKEFGAPEASNEECDECGQGPRGVLSSAHTHACSLHPLNVYQPVSEEKRANDSDAIEDFPHTMTYMYRDANNYKDYGTVVLDRRPTAEEEAAIVDACDEGDLFIPQQVGLISYSGDDEYADHCWHEFIPGDYEPSPALSPDMTVDELVARFRAAKGNWDVLSYGI